MEPLPETQQQQFDPLVRAIAPEGTLLRASPLTGGVSAQVTVLEIAEPDGRTRKLLVRRHGPADLAHNPHIARDEFALLRIVRRHGIAAPEPLHYDESGAILPSPFIVIDYIEGDTDFAPANMADYLMQMAMQLAHIHRIERSEELAFLPVQDKGFGDRPANLDDAMHEGSIRDALEAAWPLAQANRSVLLHGDYWPGNILWNDGRLAAVIDWEDARTGDPLSDLGNTRLELLWAFGVDAMLAFTDHYRSMSGIDFSNLPYWDLCAALRPCSKLSGWGLDAATEQTMRERHGMFVAEALAAMSHVSPAQHR